MSRQSTRGRHHCSSSSGSASYQGISGATSPVYHLPQEPFHSIDFGNNRNKPGYSEDNVFREPNYYNVHAKPGCCIKSSNADTHSYQHVNEDRKDYRNIENTFTDDDSCSSSRFQPYYEYQRNYDGYKQEKRYPGNFSEYDSDFPITYAGKKTFPKNDLKYQSTRSNHSILKIDRNIIVNQDTLRGGLDRVYPEAPLPRGIPEIGFRRDVLPRHDLRLSDRAQSPGISSVAGSAIVDGCGGHCVTFENICSYVLQIFFIMGILIGVSLCIAGTVLRRTKSRDLQVLVYIGAMSAMVCTLLLTVQCRVRRALRKRKRAVRIACTAIPLGDMRPVQQPLINLGNENIRPGMLATTIPMNQRPQEVLIDEQGIPWWRRTDLPGNRV